jgi:hypothetical protein
MRPGFLNDALNWLSPERRKAAVQWGPGIAGTLLLHGVVALAIILVVMEHTAQQTPQTSVHFVPIDLIRLGAETASPDAQQKSLIPQRRAAQQAEAASPTPETTAPNKSKPAPLDDLDAKLRALARLRQPPSDLKIANEQGISNVDAANGVPGDEATYSVRDYIRSVVLRRWYFNLAKLGSRNFSVPIRVAMKRDGTIVSAEIVVQTRDPLYHDIALGARNAVLLSSPIPLPAGDYPATMHFVLRLDPRDTQR